ncbi:hypothetical protein SEVIR_4G289201v4 [Setaria viridis]
MDWRGKARTDTDARTAGPGVRPAATVRHSPCARAHELVPPVFHHAFMRAVAVADFDSVLVESGHTGGGPSWCAAGRTRHMPAQLPPPLFIRETHCNSSEAVLRSLSPNRCRYSDADAARAQTFAGSAAGSP